MRRRGTILYCEKCYTPLAHTRKNKSTGDQYWEEEWKNLGGVKNLYEDYKECPGCKEPNVMPVILKLYK